MSQNQILRRGLLKIPAPSLTASAPVHAYQARRTLPDEGNRNGFSHAIVQAGHQVPGNYFF